MVWMAKHLLEGGEITDGLEIPNIGAIQLDGNVAVVDAMLDITAENADDLGF
jgi:hypothetical protein